MKFGKNYLNFLYTENERKKETFDPESSEVSKETMNLKTEKSKDCPF